MKLGRTDFKWGAGHQCPPPAGDGPELDAFTKLSICVCIRNTSLSGFIKAEESTTAMVMAKVMCLVFIFTFLPPNSQENLRTLAKTMLWSSSRAFFTSKKRLVFVKWGEEQNFLPRMRTTIFFHSGWSGISWKSSQTRERFLPGVLQEWRFSRKSVGGRRFWWRLLPLRVALQVGNSDCEFRARF